MKHPLGIKGDGHSLRAVRSAILFATIPLVAVSCSNSNPNPNTVELAPIAGVSETSDQSIVAPQKKPSLGLLTEIVRSNEIVNTGSNGQNYVEPHRTQVTTNIISNQTKFSSKAYGVAGSPRVTTGTDVRKGGGRYQVGKPYTIRGIRYVPKEDPGYKAVGLASWYGPNFHGRLTANGEVYDQFALSAAHPTLPLPSYAKVTNLENGSSVTVRINDRGPFSKGRIIDLSSRAAQLLGYTEKGVAKVKVEYVGRARMDGLDEQQLMASYFPGSVDPKSVPASARPVVVASTAKPELVAAISQPKMTRRTLDAFDTARFGLEVTDSEAAIRPNGLVNGYVSEPLGNLAIEKIARSFGETGIDEPEQGMNDLVRIKIGPVFSKSDLFQLSEKIAEYGPVNIKGSAQANSFYVEATILKSELSKVKTALQ